MNKIAAPGLGLLLAGAAACTGNFQGGPNPGPDDPSSSFDPNAGGGGVGTGRDGGVGPAVQAEGTASYWLQHSSSKVQPTTAPGPTGGTITLEGGGGATESYQIVLRPAGAALAGLDATATALTDGAGDVLAAANVTLYRQYFLDFTGIDVMGGNARAPESSPTADGRVPDALVPLHDPYTGAALGAPFDVAAGTNQPIWVDVKIPAGQAPGTYTGSIAFAAGAGAATIRVPLSVTVWDITLPDLRAVPAWFKLDYNLIGTYHAGVRDCYYSSCAADSPERQIIKRYQNLLHEHRIDPKQTLISFANGCSPPDFGAIDAALGPYMDGSYWDDGIPSSIIPAPFGPGATGDRPQSCGHDTFVDLAGRWAAHLKDKGWFDRAYVYAEDEPPASDLPAIAGQAEWMAEADRDWKAHIFDTTMASTTSAPILDPGIGIYVLCLKCYDDWYFPDGHVYGRDAWTQRRAAGKRFWFYDSNAQGPPYSTLASNTLDAAEPRIMMWGSWYEGATGFLYWDVNSWDGNDPWGPAIGFGKTGDGVLIYPGDHSGTNAPKGSPPEIAMAGPIPSIRLKMVRSGLQDWALFVLADRAGLRDMAMNEVAKVYSQLGGCTYSGCLPPINGQWFWKTDYDLMTAARHNIAAALLSHR